MPPTTTLPEGVEQPGTEPLLTTEGADNGVVITKGAAEYTGNVVQDEPVPADANQDVVDAEEEVEAAALPKEEEAAAVDKAAADALLVEPATPVAENTLPGMDASVPTTESALPTKAETPVWPGMDSVATKAGQILDLAQNAQQTDAANVAPAPGTPDETAL